MTRGREQQRAAERRVLQLLHGRATRTHIREIHAHLLRHHLHFSNLLLAHLVSVCAALRRVPYARRLFLSHPSPSLPLFNATLKALSLSPAAAPDALRLFSLLRCRSLFPDRLSFAPLLKAASFLPPALGRSVHALTLVSGFAAHPPVAVGILEIYTSSGEMDSAHRAFDDMFQKDVVAYNLMINGYCKRGDFESGFRLFRQMGDRSIVTWNSMIAGLACCGRDGEALELFREMWDYSGFEPDDATLATILPVCGRLGALDVGRWIHYHADGKGLLKSAVNVANSIIDMYCKCGDLAAAQLVFDEMPKKSVVSWNAMITGSAFNGHGQVGINLFEEMKRSGVEPNAGTFVGILGCCAHAGLVKGGRKLFASMVEDYRIEPKLEHYGCMVDLLGRCGFVEEAHELVRSMPMRPNAAIWGALLSACRNYGELGIAEMAMRELIELEPRNSGNYVLLANLYAEAGLWEEAENVRWLMKGKSVPKVPGQSLIGHEDRVEGN
ncbi:pentatricopeptide repeat-containing protein At1g09190 [Elaeis guineensis]|uniref:Pentatricopeptide repeat-containing protein At1g09190 n=1 Tax=Elaeis guineensis var. tenera TaxID=51953 RepID=A0A6I9S1Y8_ELAGV|nr:pentatricopeptide repeat-containing protein At1g09190 [Elaeis guineensis]